MLKASSQKHLGLTLDDKLAKLYKAKKGIGILRDIYYFVRRSALLPVYKAFIGTYLDYGDIFYGQPSNPFLSLLHITV